ncbi:MAG: hypothetical protein HYU37_13150 [Acidobacteria bacterium]|nr:hypothetical protein [Acidobacteriota bacterium]
MLLGEGILSLAAEEAIVHLLYLPLGATPYDASVFTSLTVSGKARNSFGLTTLTV